MSEATQRILKQALNLPPAERAALIDGLVSSLDRPDPGLDELWRAEAQERLLSYRAGEVSAVPEEEIFEALRGL